MSSKLKILHVYKDYPPVVGGIEGTMYRLATAQAAGGHDVTVLVTARGSLAGTRREEGVRVVRTRRWATVASTPLGAGLPLRLRQLEADIGHFHYPYPLGELAHLVFGRSRHTLVSYYSDIVRQRRLLRLWAPLARRFLRRADAVLVTSPVHAASSPFLREVSDRCRVVPLGVDVGRFAAPDPERSVALREELGAPLLLFVGRLRYYKGLSYLIEAMESLDGAHLAVVGDGPMARTWRAKASRGGAAQRIHFLGDIAERELPALLAAADVFVFPSVERSEAFGLAQVEAMAAGTPVVCTALGTGTDWVNRDEETGLVVPPRSASALTSAIDRLLRDPQLRHRMGKAAQERARSHFSTERMVSGTEAVYREVLDSAGGD